MSAPGRGAAFLLFAASAAIWTWAPETGRELAWLAAFLGLAFWLNGWAVTEARTRLRDLPGTLAIWAVFVVAGFTMYVHRERVFETAIAWTDEIGLTRPDVQITGSGEFVVQRGFDGTFLIPGEINGSPARFVFDTGATAVVLTAETAERLGIGKDRLDFRVPVSTANGKGLAAPVMLEQLSVGPITVPRMPALVSMPGMLHENLLGQSFLDRLGSYEVRGRRLVLRAG